MTLGFAVKPLRSKFLEQRTFIHWLHWRSPMQKHAIVVVGPESSGNRYFVDVLVQCAGCAGTSGHDQPFDAKDQFKENFELLDLSSNDATIAFHRSVPHGGQWIRLPRIAQQLHDAGYYSTLIILVRAGLCYEESQVKNTHISNVNGKTKARGNVTQAWRVIFESADSFDEFHVVPYASLRSEKYLLWILKTIGLRATGTLPEFADGDKQYLD